MEVDFDCNLHPHRVTLFHGGLELPGLHRLNRLFVEPHPQAAQDANITGTPIGSHDQAESAYALVFGLARLFGEFRLGLVNYPRRTNTTTDVKNSASGTAAFTRPEPRSVTGAHATTATRPNASSRASAVGGQHRARHRITQIRHVLGGQNHLWWNHARRFSRKLRMVIAHHHHRRRDLLHGEFWQFALAGLQNIAIAAATTAANLRL